MERSPGDQPANSQHEKQHQKDRVCNKSHRYNPQLDREHGTCQRNPRARSSVSRVCR
jgi:hypothetical protein